MPPRPAATCGTRAPTAKKRVATAIPNWPVMSSRAMIDQVIYALSRHLSPLSSGRVALHAAGIGGSATAAADLRGGGEAAFRPVGTGLHDMPAALQAIDGRPRHAVLDHEHAGPRGARPEREREMRIMRSRGVDRFLQVHFGMNMPQKELRGPLILLIAAGRAPCQIRLAVAQRHGRTERGARPLARREGRRMIFLKPEHLRAAAEAEAEFRNHRRRLQPAAGRGRRDHVAGGIDDVEMHGVAAHFAETADGRLTGAHGADRLAVSFLTAQFYDRAKPFH